MTELVPDGPSRVSFLIAFETGLHPPFLIT